MGKVQKEWPWSTQKATHVMFWSHSMLQTHQIILSSQTLITCLQSRNYKFPGDAYPQKTPVYGIRQFLELLTLIHFLLKTTVGTPAVSFQNKICLCLIGLHVSICCLNYCKTIIMHFTPEVGVYNVSL